MLIDNSTFKLPINNFIPISNKKNQIVIGNTCNTDMKHYIGWIKRYNGNYKKTAAYTIDLKGNIFQHFQPEFSSNMMGNYDVDKQIILILLENEGYLTQDEDKKNFYTWFGNIYNRKQNIVLKRWRGHTYWVPYTIKQKDVCVELCKQLCSDFNIEKQVISYNTKIDNFSSTYGILYKSNYSLAYTDVSPAWDFDYFKDKIESTNNKI
jgi:hypothetical protein